jgi:NAD(P)H-hydrate epimerase
MILARAASIPSNVCMFALHAPFPSVVHDSAGTKAVDRAIIEAGTPGFALMMRAAQASLERISELEQRHTTTFSKGMVVLAGPGNNGGDGYGLAALANLAGYDVTVIAYGAPQNDAQLARVFCENLGLDIRPWAGQLPAAGIYIDALLGIGLNRAPEGALAEIIEALNAVHETGTSVIVALDIASGLDADSGRAPGVCVTAHQTVTFLTLKAGLLTGEGPDRCGELCFADLGFETKLAPAMARLLTPPGLMNARPAATAHKGTKGSLALLAGAAGMEGAGQLAGLAALRAGAGKVFWATSETPFERPAELIVTTPDALIEQIADWRVCIAGPGLGNGLESDLGDGYDAQLETLWQTDLPLVLDADGLRWLARAQPPARNSPLIATPTPWGGTRPARRYGRS